MSTIRSILKGKSPVLHSVSPDDSVLHAVQVMCVNRVGVLLVGLEGHLMGILSERDVMLRVILGQRDPSNSTVDEVMTTDVVCIDADSGAEDAMALMTERRVRHLPILEHGFVMGIVSIGDLVRSLSVQQDYELRSLQEYVSGAHA
jgi:signal-transduction protein with cAMP-binding, CBS, and nucleotidyltransferase domain